MLDVMSPSDADGSCYLSANGLDFMNVSDSGFTC